MEVLQHDRKKAGELLASREAAAAQMKQELEAVVAQQQQELAARKADILCKDAHAAKQVTSKMLLAMHARQLQ